MEVSHSHYNPPPVEEPLQYPLVDEWATQPIWTLWREKLLPQAEVNALPHNVGPDRLGHPASLLMHILCHDKVTNNFTIHLCRVLCHTVLILRHSIHPRNRNYVRSVKQFLSYSTSYCTTQTCT